MPRHGALAENLSGLFVLIQILKYRRGAHATPNTHGHHAIPVLAAAHLVDQLRGQLGARAAQGMPERDRAAIDIGDLLVEAELMDDCKRLGSEKLRSIRSTRYLRASSRPSSRPWG